MKNRKSSATSRKSSPSVKLSDDDARPLTPAAKEGRAYGLLVGESAAQILLNAYAFRNQPFTPASEQYRGAWERLESALNARAHEPAIAEALKDLERAYDEVLSEMEDRTWFAAWHAVVGIFRGGAR